MGSMKYVHDETIELVNTEIKRRMELDIIKTPSFCDVLQELLTNRDWRNE